MTDSLPKTGSSSVKPSSAKSFAAKTAAAKTPAAKPAASATSVQAPVAAPVPVAKTPRRRVELKPAAKPEVPVPAVSLAEPASRLTAVAAAVSEIVAETAKTAEKVQLASEHLVERTAVSQVPALRPESSQPQSSQPVFSSEPSETPVPSAPGALFGSAASAWTFPGLAAATSSRLSGFTPSFIPSSMVDLMSASPFRNYEEVAAFGKANFEALIQANAVFTQGLEALSKELLSVAQTSLEKSTAATKALLDARTVQDVVALQADYTKDALDTLVLNSTRFGEIGIKLATDASAPLTARINSTVEKAVRPAAAASKAAASAVSNVVDIATSNEAVA